MDELDHLLRKMSLINASKRGLRKLLFINLDPLALYDESQSESIVRFCADYNILPRHVVVEISEGNAVCCFERFRKLIVSYKSDGFSIACDGINCPFANIDAISSLNPDFIKIGGPFVRGINLNANIGKTVELGSVITIAKMMKAKVIAVGVETPGELSCLYRLGVDAAQGNFIAPPQKELGGISDSAAQYIAGLNTGTNI
jgi:EAL domain-containing protein (putative c-di-GMP-specific phosphodiesterase class I)